MPIAPYCKYAELQRLAPHNPRWLHVTGIHIAASAAATTSAAAIERIGGVNAANLEMLLADLLLHTAALRSCAAM